MASGKRIICMGTVFILGLMVGDTKETTKTIRKMVKELTNGPMVDFTLEVG